MDSFGIGAALTGCFQVLRQAFRATGRTTRMVNSYDEDDRIVFATEREARRVERLLKDRGKTLRWSVVSTKEPHRVFEAPTIRGRLIFDHGWLEEFYALRIAQACDEVRRLQDGASGYGEPHRKTREAAEMISKFRDIT